MSDEYQEMLKAIQEPRPKAVVGYVGLAQRVMEKPKREKWACIARFGQIGDYLLAASILPGLREQGYKICYIGCEPNVDILACDPHIDHLVRLPPGWPEMDDLIDYFRDKEKEFDLVLHLSCSIEESLLFRPNQFQFYWPLETIRRICDVNHWERIHDLAGVPHKFAMRFYPSSAEISWAVDERRRFGYGNPLIVWLVGGSQHDKIWPYNPQAVASVLQQHPTAHIVMLGDNQRRDTESAEAVTNMIAGWFPAAADRIHRYNHLTLRSALTFVRYANVVVGPDTGILHSVALMDWPAKVLLLSFASFENVAKHHRNTTVLHAAQHVVCWPCHKLHAARDTCNIEPITNGAACITSIKPEHVAAAVLEKLAEAPLMQEASVGE